jgi:putative hemolysin
VDETGLLPASVAGLPDWLVRCVAAYARRMSGLAECEEILRDHSKAPTVAEWAQGVLRTLGIAYELRGVDLKAAFPTTGPVVIAPNHPFGALDALVVLSALESVRCDFRILGQAIWKRIPQTAPRLFALLPTAGKPYQSSNARSLRAAIRWTQQGHALWLFPAPSVAHWRWDTRRIEDPQWSDLLGYLVSVAGATVVPMYFEGRNSGLFQVVSAVCPRLRHALLLRELLNKRGTHVSVTIGHGMRAAEFAPQASPPEITRELRRRVYALKAGM